MDEIKIELRTFNVSTSTMMEQLIELNQSHKEYSLNFVKQQHLLMEEIRKLTVQGARIMEKIHKRFDI